MSEELPAAPPPEEKPKHNFHDPAKRGTNVHLLVAARKGVPYKKPKQDGANDELMALRHVMLNPKKYDITELQIFLRKIKDQDPKGFLARYSSAEDLHRKEREAKKSQEKAFVTPAGAASGPIDADAGTARCIELCEQLLSECR